VRLLRVLRGHTNTTVNVLQLLDRFEVIRVTAGAKPAKVVKHEPLGDLASESPIHPAMD